MIRNTFEKIYNICGQFLVARLFLLLIKLNFVELMGFLNAPLIMMIIYCNWFFFFNILVDCGNAYFKENLVNNQS